MNAKDLQTLKDNVNNIIKIITRDGESLFAKVVLVSEDDQDLIYELLSTSRESQYEEFDEQPAYRINMPAALIVSAITRNGMFQIGPEHSSRVFLSYVVLIGLLWYLVGRALTRPAENERHSPLATILWDIYSRCTA